MAVSAAAVMRQIRNYFQTGYLSGDFSVTGGVLLPAPACGYVLISGSAWHDGVWAVSGDTLLDAAALPDEQFTGRVYELHPPNDFLALVAEISDYDEKNPVGALQGESFGDYSYTRAGAGQPGTQGWQTAFRSRLDPYRRMFSGVES